MICFKWNPIEKSLIDKLNLHIKREYSNIDKETKNIVYLNNHISYPIVIFRVKKNNTNWYIFKEQAECLIKELKAKKYKHFVKEIEEIINSNELTLS